MLARLLDRMPTMEDRESGRARGGVWSEELSEAGWPCAGLLSQLPLS